MDGLGRPTAVVLVGVGVVLTLNPLYLFPHATETEYALSSVEPMDGDSGAVIAFDDLPPEAQAAFVARLNRDETRQLWSHDDADAIAALAAHDVVRYRGTVYRYELIHADGMGNGAARMLLAVAGGIALALGALTGVAGSARPERPEHGLVVAVGVAAAIAWVLGYEFTFEGRETLAVTFGPALYGSLFGFVTGVALRRRNHRWVAAGLKGGVLVTGGLGVAMETGNLPLLISLVPVVSVPWTVLGFALARPGTGRFRSILPGIGDETDYGG